MNKNKQQKGENTDGESRQVEPIVIRRGDRVLITGKHPWAGHTGTATEEMQTPVGKMWRVELDNGMAAGCKLEYLKAV